MVCFSGSPLPQDPWGKQGLRQSPKGDTEVWTRTLSNGDTAVALFNKNGTDNGAWG